MEFIEASEASGKTVKNIKESGTEEVFVITFTDGTYTAFSSSEHCDEIYNESLDKFEDNIKKEFGIITHEEYNTRKFNEQERRAEKDREIELALYENLKAKYEN